MKTNKEKAEYFVKIADPKSTRRTILESTRDILKVLQGYEEFKRTRQQRTELVETFKKNNSEIKILIQQMRNMLPRVAAREIKKAPIAPQAAEKPVKELKRIEQELSDIESKLGSL